MAHEYSRDDHHNDGFRGADGGRARPAARGRGAPGGERRGIPLSDLNPVTTDASRKVIGCAIDVHKAKAGAAIVLDAKTGEVLAMVNLPTYNPNNPVKIAGKSRNRAIVDMFEPGSTLKPVTAAAAIESGVRR